MTLEQFLNPKKWNKSEEYPASHYRYCGRWEAIVQERSDIFVWIMRNLVIHAEYESEGKFKTALDAKHDAFRRNRSIRMSK